MHDRTCGTDLRCPRRHNLEYDGDGAFALAPQPASTQGKDTNGGRAVTMSVYGNFVAIPAEDVKVLLDPLEGLML